jgi:hypothetical protein
MNRYSIAAVNSMGNAYPQEVREDILGGMQKHLTGSKKLKTKTFRDN